MTKSINQISNDATDRDGKGVIYISLKHCVSIPYTASNSEITVEGVNLTTSLLRLKMSEEVGTPPRHIWQKAKDNMKELERAAKGLNL